MVTTNQSCPQKSKGLIYTADETWNHKTVKLINLTYYCNRWRAFEKTVMSLMIPHNVDSFLTKLGTSSSSKTDPVQWFLSLITILFHFQIAKTKKHNH